MKQNTPLNIKNLISIELPTGSKLIDRRGVDTYIGWIITPSLDSFEIEVGSSNIIWNLDDRELPLIINEKERNDFQKNGISTTTDKFFFSKTPDIDIAENILDKQYYLYDSSNGLVKKIVQPKIIGKGMSGVYIQEVGNDVGINISAYNLDSTTHRMAIQAFRSIKLLK